MDIQTMLRQHAAGFYDNVFAGRWDSQSAMTGYIVHNDEPENQFNSRYLVTGACHAPINNAIQRAKALGVITMADRRLVTNQGAVMFYDWLINKSFFADVFLCKDPVLSLQHGFVKRVDVSAAKWLGAAQLARLSTSEFKINMHAVYDILASGFDIHPTLLVILATELGLVTDKKTIKLQKLGSLDYAKRALSCTHSSHLPFCHADTPETLKALCKDDPNKPIWSRSYQTLFNEARWPAFSNQVVCEETRETGTNRQRVTEMINGLLRGTPSLLFNLVETIEVKYTSLWQDAIQELKVKVNPSNDVAKGGGTPINLSPIELLSKELKLGE